MPAPVVALPTDAIQRGRVRVRVRVRGRVRVRLRHFPQMQSSGVLLIWGQSWLLGILSNSVGVEVRLRVRVRFRVRVRVRS